MQDRLRIKRIKRIKSPEASSTLSHRCIFEFNLKKVGRGALLGSVVVVLAGRLEVGMPKVGKKTYPYTKAGKSAAKTAAARTGKKVVSRKKRY